jgi:hypothetical protein
MLAIAPDNPSASFHVRQVFAIELASTFEIHAILFDGEGQLGDEPIKAVRLREITFDSRALPRSILFFIRNCGEEPGRLSVAVSDVIDSEVEFHEKELWIS